MTISKRKGLICFIAAIIFTLSVPLTALADDITWCPGCGRDTLDIYYNPAPSCTTNGVLEHNCGYCSYLYLEAIPAFGHSPNIPNATCTEDKKCTTCGYLYESKLGHNFGWNDLYKYYECIRCGAITYEL